MQPETQRPLKPEKTRFKADFSFVNWIRFVAMLSIVYEHCLDLHDPNTPANYVNLNPNGHFVENISQAQAMPWIVQPMKFGTICFFLISGYLLGKHLTSDQSPWSYYRRRLRVVGIPFLIAFGLYFLKHLGVYGLLIGRYDLSMLTPDFIQNKIWITLFMSSYWFIFSFLIALGLFFVFWRHSDSTLYGLVTGLIAVFYSVNIYFGWIEQRHNLAMPAYLFYLWLGVWLSRHENVITYIQKMPNKWLVGSVVLFLCLAVVESKYLWSINSVSPFNTIRLSNQLFSMSFFALLLKNDFSSKLVWLNPRSESFGIYLYHLYFIEAFSIFSTYFSFMLYSVDYTGLALAGITILRWIIIYTLTLMFVKLVNQTRFRWLLGN
ncbi:acyltransferase family protein [Spirosoma rigui]|uniref:acyltransferase family protein n=1 Tax=Spirosoma rigui TaxID=564064 RepID=UPI0012D3148B|nr:acyltransferase [Spirosoma rigui]